MPHDHRRNPDDDFTPRHPLLQKRWVAIVAVVLMLGALAIYVLTNDESDVPGESLQAPVPAGP